MHVVGRRKNRQYLNELSSPPPWSRKAVASPPTPREGVQNEVRRRIGPGLRRRAGPSERPEGCAGAVIVWRAHPSAGSPASGSLPPKKRAGKGAQAGWSKAQRKGGLLGKASSSWKWRKVRRRGQHGAGPPTETFCWEVPAAQEKRGKRGASAVGPLFPQDAPAKRTGGHFFFLARWKGKNYSYILKALFTTRSFLSLLPFFKMALNPNP